MGRVSRGWSWIASRSPRAYLWTGWVVFVLGCYPGFLSVESALELYEVRSGIYSDTHSGLMTLCWRALELVNAGPFPMLVLQSTLFLFGLAAVLRAVLSPRAAAVLAAAVLLFPPVFVVMATIWPDSLMAGALVAGAAALLEPRRRWKIFGIALLVLACSCRFAAIAAIVPILFLVPTSFEGWRRTLAALGVALAIEGAAIASDRALVEVDTFEPQQALMLPDTVAILRRNHVTSAKALGTALEGTPLIDVAKLKDITSRGRDPLGWWPLAHGDKRPFSPIITPDEVWSLFRAWHHAVVRHPVAWFKYRKALASQQLAFVGNPPIFEDLGDFDLLAPVHHRALPSTWELGWREVVDTAHAMQLFRPWLYFLLAIVVLVIGRRDRLIRVFAVSGLAYEVALSFFGYTPEYRYSHWLVSASCIALVVLLAKRRYAR